MKKLLTRLIKDERGMALVLVLALLAIGGLTIVPLLSHMTTGLQAGRIQEAEMAWLYAADAGVEDGLWRIKNEDLPFAPYDYETEHHYTLPKDINGKDVDVCIKQVWPLEGLESDVHGTTPHEELVVVGFVSDFVPGEYQVEMAYDGSLGDVEVDRVAVWLPAGYDYVTDSSSGITTDNPNIVDWRGGKALEWDFDPPVNFEDLPVGDLSPQPGGFTQTVQYPVKRILNFDFYPQGNPTSTLPWVRTTCPDLYLSWDICCECYQVTSTASDNITGKQITTGTYASREIASKPAPILRGNYQAIGNSLMEDITGDYHGVRDVLYGESSASVSDIPTDADLKGAYLYWSAWRDYDGEQVADLNVGLKVNDQSVYYNEEGEAVLGELPVDPETETLRPNDDGRYDECYYSGDSPNYECVDDVSSDGSSTYVYSRSGYTLKDTYNIQNHSEGLGVIDSVTVYARARAYYSGSCADMRMQIMARTHSADYYGDIITLIGNAGWDTYSETWTTNPNTGQPWTWDEIDDLQIGIKLYDDGYGYPQCTQVYAEVTYQPPFQGMTADRWWLLDNNYPDYSYSCFKDVTEAVRLVTTTGNANYKVIGVAGSTGSEWSYAGWSLVIIYFSPSEDARQLYLYDGFLYAGSWSHHTFTISGFKAPPEAEAKLTCFVGEGDECYAGDYIKFNGYYLSDEVNPQTNVWNGKSSGLDGLFIDGVDIDTFEVSSPIIQGGDTSAEIYLRTYTDCWNLCYLMLSFRDVPGGNRPDRVGTISYSYGGG